MEVNVYCPMTGFKTHCTTACAWYTDGDCNIAQLYHIDSTLREILDKLDKVSDQMDPLEGLQVLADCVSEHNEHGETYHTLDVNAGN